MDRNTAAELIDGSSPRRFTGMATIMAEAGKPDRAYVSLAEDHPEFVAYRNKQEAKG